MKLRFQLCFALSVILAAPAFAAVNGDIEVALTMASIEYQAKNYPKCRQMVSDLLKRDPDNVGARELLALSQRGMNDDEGAAATYGKLLKGADPAKAAAYHFEMAMIRYKQKKSAEAKSHFQYAANAGFNGGTSNFYLGIMEFNAKAWKKARHHLTASLTYNDGKSMTPITRYYLANTYAQLGKTEAALHSYHEVDDTVAERMGNSGIDDTTKGIRTNALKELKALDKGQRYASLTLMQQWDSNVQTNPTEVANPVATASQRSAKSVLSVAAGYTSSPAKKIQVTPSFSYSTNYNYNYLARNFNFMSFTPALFAIYKPYARLSGGIKADGIFSMQNMLDPDESTQHLKYRPFSLTGDVGPIVKYELTPRINVAGELYWRPKHFYLDPATGDSRRSGGGVAGKLTSEFVSGYAWWNPSVYVGYEWDHPSGKTFRSYALSGGVADTVSVTEKFLLTGSVDIISTDYNESGSTSQGKRDDLNMVFKVAGSYPIVDKWTASGDVSYTQNDSSISTIYKYERWTGELGATYSF
ncbi:MAG: hypothetical protein HY075_15735 [Deltaproteobacteria bacterium]|nr:hypothetical protein [Deltaproteobacteria bacterium]